MSVCKRLTNKVAIVTGAGKGIGRAIAIRFAEEGAKVVVNDIDAINAQKIIKEISSINGNAIAVIADVTRSNDVEKLIKVTLDSFGRIDILVNNVGIYEPKPFLDISEEEWDRVMEVNVKSVFMCCKKVVPHMVKRGCGKIINIASISGKRGDTLISSYITSKHAVIGLTRALATELIQYGIIVNAVCPGITATDRAIEYLKERAEISKRKVEDEVKAKLCTIPIGRFAKPEEIAGLVAFLSSDESNYIVGQAINICGGALTSA